MAISLLVGATLLTCAWAPPAVARAKKPRPKLCSKHVEAGSPSSTTTTTVPCVAREHIQPKDAAGRWSGTFMMHALQTVPQNSCTSAWAGTVNLLVRRNGSVGGDGDAMATEAPSCVAGFTGVAAANHVTLSLSGTFTGSDFQLRFVATSVDPPGYEAGFHVLYYPGPPTVRVPLVGTQRAAGVVDLYNAGPEELSGGGGASSLLGVLVLKHTG